MADRSRTVRASCWKLSGCGGGVCCAPGCCGAVCPGGVSSEPCLESSVDPLPGVTCPFKPERPDGAGASGTLGGGGCCCVCCCCVAPTKNRANAIARAPCVTRKLLQLPAATGLALQPDHYRRKRPRPACAPKRPPASPFPSIYLDVPGQLSATSGVCSDYQIQIGRPAFPAPLRIRW